MGDSDRQVFGPQIKDRRLARGLSLTDLSASTGIEKSLLSKLERGVRVPSTDHVRVIANTLELSEDVLLAGAGLLPEDVKNQLSSLASVVTASARQTAESNIGVPSILSAKMSQVLAASVDRPGHSSELISETEFAGKKSSAAYRAHSYHTKVPPETIVPLLEHFTRPGDVILDPFCGSGMTGVAALYAGRHALLSDLSPAAVHISKNYTSYCDPVDLLREIDRLRSKLHPTIAWLYDINQHGQPHQRTEYVVWSDRFRCPQCDDDWSFWDAARGPDGNIVGKTFECPNCGADVQKATCEFVGEEPVQANLSQSGISSRLVRPLNELDMKLIADSDAAAIPYWLPNVPFDRSREMWRASHEKMGIRSAADFYSRRNLHALAALRHLIVKVENDRVRDALLFAFTAIVNRASRRYQWNSKRPTNVMAGTMYVSSLRYEWNVWSLFERKARDIVRYFQEFPRPESTVECLKSDARNLRNVPDSSIDFVFMDPPFGSNIFYADVSLLWDAWLGDETDRSTEMVVNKHLKADQGGKSLSDYESLITEAFSEVARVLKQPGNAVLVFSNSDDKVWQSIQRAISESGLEIRGAGVLDKGQRSIKGVQVDLGSQKATRLDLVLTLSHASDSTTISEPCSVGDLSRLVSGIVSDAPHPGLATDEVYSRILQHVMLRGQSVKGISLAAVEDACASVCQRNDEGLWRPVGTRNHVQVDEDTPCFVDEYLSPLSSTDLQLGKKAKRVSKPFRKSVKGSRNSVFYNAHSYMTKVPPEAARSYIEHYTRKGDVVLDMFAGSGMTGLAALLSGRSAILADISVMSAHLSHNHTSPCDPQELGEAFDRIYRNLLPRFQDLYRVPTRGGSPDGYAYYTLWSDTFRCPSCRKGFSLYDAIDTSTGRVGRKVACPACGQSHSKQKLRAISSKPVEISYVDHNGARRAKKPTRSDLNHIKAIGQRNTRAWIPRVKIDRDRDMYNVSALHLRGISEIADFYTERNLTALAELRSAILEVSNSRVRQALMFAFTNTAWHGTRMRRFNARGGQRPLTGTLYIPQISSEVNVLEVMKNKIRHLEKFYAEIPQTGSSIQFLLESATELPSIPDKSVDYIFTDPPFGSNIFYADCNLIAESWLGGLTRVADEVVINRTLRPEQGGKSLGDYGVLMAKSLNQAHRVLKDGAWMTMVFHSTDSRVWSAIHAAAESAGFKIEGASKLDRQQMSHKGYKGRSGKENVAHYDVVMSLRKSTGKRRGASTRAKVAPSTYLQNQVSTLMKRAPTSGRAQWIHSEIIRALVHDGYDLGSVSFAEVSKMIRECSSAS